MHARDGRPAAAVCRKDRRARPAAPELPRTAIAAAARGGRRCTRCPLHGPATQTVFGEGPGDARLVFVGEQPGDQEDLAGRPFVGPAGEVFDRALARPASTATKVYVTNAVKHFKYEPRGKRRIHSGPTPARSGTADGGSTASSSQSRRSSSSRSAPPRRSRSPAARCRYCASAGRCGSEPGRIRHRASVVPAAAAGRAEKAAEYAKFVEDLALVRKLIGNADVAA